MLSDSQWTFAPYSISQSARRSADHHSITNLPEVKEHALCCGQRNILPRGHHNNTSTSTKVRDSLLGEIETSPSETKDYTIIFWIKTYTTFCCVFSKAKILFFLKANLFRLKNHLMLFLVVFNPQYYIAVQELGPFHLCCCVPFTRTTFAFRVWMKVNLDRH